MIRSDLKQKNHFRAMLIRCFLFHRLFHVYRQVMIAIAQQAIGGCHFKFMAKYEHNRDKYTKKKSLLMQISFADKHFCAESQHNKFVWKSKSERCFGRRKNLLVFYHNYVAISINQHLKCFSLNSNEKNKLKSNFFLIKSFD